LGRSRCCRSHNPLPFWLATGVAYALPQLRLPLLSRGSLIRGGYAEYGVRVQGWAICDPSRRCTFTRGQLGILLQSERCKIDKVIFLFFGGLLFGFVLLVSGQFNRR